MSKAMASKYDELLDRYHTIATTKAGTRYEILAAMLAKTLEEQKRVVHDIKLLGDSDVPHQIDVTVEEPAGRKHLLIECKDFDISGDKVGLSIIRDFWAVVDDTKPDSAWVLTCNGFTSEALKFAKAKGIKCIVMRLYTDQDDKGRIKRIVLSTHLLQPIEPRVSLFVDEDDFPILEMAKKAAGIGESLHLNDDAYFLLSDGIRKHFNEVLTAEMNDAMGTRLAGEVRAIVHPNGRRLFIGGTEVPYKGIIINFAILSETSTQEIVSQRTAELLVEGIQDADMIIFDDQIRRRRIDPDTGEID